MPPRRSKGVPRAFKRPPRDPKRTTRGRQEACLCWVFFLPLLHLTETNFNEKNFPQGLYGLCHAENAILNNPKGFCRSKRTTFLTRRAHNGRTTPEHNPKGLCRSTRTILLTGRAHNPCAQPPTLVRTMKLFSVKYSRGDFFCRPRSVKISG